MAAELHQQGLQALLETYFRGSTQPSTLYVGLAEDTSLAEGATLSSVTEVSGSGYSRQSLTCNSSGWVTSEDAGSGDWRVVSAQVTFTASGTWSTARTVFVTNVASGTSGILIASGPLSVERTLGNGDQLKVTITITLQG